MKLFQSSYLVLTVIFINSFFSAYSQEICLVTADPATGTKYIVYWQQPVDITGLDSMVIFRKQSTDNIFTQISAVKIDATSPTFYVDATANTIDPTKYAIAFKSGAVVGAMSEWHQPIVYDYTGNGGWIWTAYQKENQVDESYIGAYTCLLNMGTGYTSIGFMNNTTYNWTDANYQQHTIGQYVIEASLPSCEYQEKAEINTSRSNIKQQFTNAEASIEELDKALFILSPNPSNDYVTLNFNDKMNGELWINNVSGKLVYSTTQLNTTMKIDLTNFEAGIYFVNVAIDGKINTQKFVKN